MIWPKRGMTRGGFAFELPMSAPRIDGSGSSQLPTPTAQNMGGTGRPAEDVERRWAEGNAVSLIDRVALLGTPTTSDAKGASPNHAGTLAEHLALLPTPTGDDANNVTRDSGDYQSLARTAHLLPTPLAADAANARNSTAGRTKVQPSVEAGTWNGKGLESLSDLAFRGAFTSPPSDDGNTSSDKQHPGQLTIGDA